MTEKIHQSIDSLAILAFPILQHMLANAPKRYAAVLAKCRIYQGWGEWEEMWDPHCFAEKNEKTKVGLTTPL